MSRPGSVERSQSLAVLRVAFAEQVERGEVQIPMLPEVAARVVAAANDPDSSARDLADLILADPMLAAHVMRLVTSAAYRPVTPIESLHHAISWLGMAEIAELAFTAAVRSRLLNIPRQRQRVERLWSTAVGAAAWGRSIAELRGGLGETSYLAGLVHEIGTPVCLQALTDLARDGELPLPDAVLDALVAQFRLPVGILVATRWQLPPAVAAVVRDWSEWRSAQAFQEQCAVTFLAHQLAEHTLARSEPLAVSIGDDPVVGYLRLDHRAIAELVAQAAQVRAVVDSFRL